MSHWKRFIAPISIVSYAFVPTPGFAIQFLTVQEAQKICFPTANSFESVNIFFTPEQISQIETESGQKVAIKGQQVWKGKVGEEAIGYLIVDHVIGKHLLIDYAVALNLDGSVRQVEILEYRENYGGEIRNASWLKQFIGKTRDSKFTIGDEIVNISGATLSSQHVTEGIKRVLVTYNVAIK